MGEKFHNNFWIFLEINSIQVVVVWIRKKEETQIWYPEKENVNKIGNNIKKKLISSFN